MEKINNIAQYVYEFIVNTLFGEITDNLWYTNNLDKIRGVGTVVICILVFSIAVCIVIAVLRFLSHLISMR